jgi:hypothetical protein
MKKQLKSLEKWSKVVGTWGLITGAIMALLGYGIFYVGAIPGLLIVILSIRLLRASRSAKRLNYNLRFLHSETDMYDETLGIFASYFRLQAIFLIGMSIAVLFLTGLGMYYSIDYLSIAKQEWSRVFHFF